MQYPAEIGLDYSFYIIIILLMRRDYYRRKQRGITFIEIVISLLLLGIAIGAVIGAFVISKASATRARHRVSAINLTRAKIETIKGLTYSQIPASAGVENVVMDQGLPGPGDELSGQCTTTVLDVYGNAAIYKVSTKIAWTEFGNALEETLITLISRH